MRSKYATHASTLQHTAKHHNALQHTETHCNTPNTSKDIPKRTKASMALAADSTLASCHSWCSWHSQLAASYHQPRTASPTASCRIVRRAAQSCRLHKSEWPLRRCQELVAHAIWTAQWGRGTGRTRVNGECHKKQESYSGESLRDGYLTLTDASDASFCLRSLLCRTTRLCKSIGKDLGLEYQDSIVLLF